MSFQPFPLLVLCSARLVTIVLSTSASLKSSPDSRPVEMMVLEVDVIGVRDGGKGNKGSGEGKMIIGEGVSCWLG